MLKSTNNITNNTTINATKEFFNDPKKLIAVLSSAVINEDIRSFVHNLNNKKRGSVLSKHFYFSGRRGYLVHHCNGSPYIAMRKNGIHLFPWEMGRVPKNFYEDERNRIDSIRWAFTIENYTVPEFRKEFAYLLKYYKNSTARALQKSGFIVSRDGGWGIEPQFNVKEWYKACKIRWLLN